MQTPSIALDIGADVGKDEIVIACAEGAFSRRKVRNRRTELSALLKSLPAGSRIGMESTVATMSCSPRRATSSVW
jgi:hypothetical protein